MYAERGRSKERVGSVSRQRDGAGNRNAGTAQVRVQITGLASQEHQSPLASAIPGFRVNVSTILLIIEAPDFPMRMEQIPVVTGVGTVTVAAGPDRTFRLEVDNQHGFLIYHGLPQTHHLAAGTTTRLQFPLHPIETILPLATVDQTTPGQAKEVVLDDVESLVQGLRLSIPAHAIPQPITLSVNEVYNPAHIPAPPTQASVLLALGPSDVPLTRPVTLTFPYHAALLTTLGVAETRLRLRRFSPSQQAWLPLPHQSIDIKSKHLTAPLERFGLYTLTVDPEPTPPTYNIGIAQHTPGDAAISLPASPRLPHPLPWRDYRLRLTLQDEVRGTTGIIFRYQDTKTYYQFVWNLRHNTARFIKHYKGHSTVLAEQSLPYNIWRPYYVEVIAKGKTLRVSIDGASIFAIVDIDIPAGPAALNCQDKQRACFNDVRIEAL